MSVFPSKEAGQNKIKQDCRTDCDIVHQDDDDGEGKEECENKCEQDPAVNMKRVVNLSNIQDEMEGKTMHTPITTNNEFKTVYDKVNIQRRARNRTAMTPNNKHSSRSHLIIAFEAAPAPARPQRQ